MRGRPVRNGGILALVGFVVMALALQSSTNMVRSSSGELFVIVQDAKAPDVVTAYSCPAKASSDEDARCPGARRDYRNWIWRWALMALGGAVSFVIGLVLFVRGVRAAGRVRRAEERASSAAHDGSWEPDPDAWARLVDPQEEPRTRLRSAERRRGTW